MPKCINQVTEIELQEIKALAERCRKHDGNTIPIYPNLLLQYRTLPSTILFYHQQVLIAFLGIYFFYEDKCELSLLVDPLWRRQKIAKSLMECITPVISLRHLNKILCSVPNGPDNHWLTNHGFSYQKSEYQMLWKNAYPVFTIPDDIHFAPATLNDIGPLTIINNQCFPSEAQVFSQRFEELLNKPEYTVIVIYKNNQIIGKAHIHHDKENHRLSDIAVLNEFQGQGLGTLLIKYCIRHLLDTSALPITLEVESHNEVALHIYQKLGFISTNVCDFWLGSLCR